MKSLKEHLALKNSRFNQGYMRMSVWWGIEEIRELRYTIGLLAALLDVALMFFFGYSFFRATIVSLVFDLACNGIVSLISSYKERQYRLWQDARDRLAKTLNRMKLNKTRKYYARETGFKD